MSTVFPRSQVLPSLRHKLQRDYRRLEAARKVRNPDQSLTDEDLTTLDAYEFMLCHAFEELGSTAVRSAFADLADVLGVSEALVCSHFRFLLQDLEQCGAKRKRAQTVESVVKKRNGVINVALDLGELIRGEVEERVMAYEKSAAPNSATENSALSASPAPPCPAVLTESENIPTIDENNACASWGELEKHCFYSTTDFASKYRLAKEYVETSTGSQYIVFAANDIDSDTVHASAAGVALTVPVPAGIRLTRKRCVMHAARSMRGWQ